MSIMLITAVPGHGKTLKMVEIIKQNQGRQIYANIDGLTLEHDPIPEDWRDCEDGSLVVIDEVHQRWPGTGKPGPSTDPEVNALDEHRHRGIDFVIATQFPRKIHHEVRDYVERHLHFLRLSGLEASTIYEWPQVEARPSDAAARSTADKTTWKYPKSLYSCYVSSSQHTKAYKFRLPSKLKFALIFVTLAMVYLVNSFMSRDSFLTTAIKGGEQQSLTQASNEQPKVQLASNNMDLGTSTTQPSVMGCVWNKTDCLCYSTDGQPLNQSINQCMELASKPLPYEVKQARRK
jgi:Zonula occludens toxin